jgi:hypothetical protein
VPGIVYKTGVWLALSLCTGISKADTSACDPAILQDHQHPQGYRERGEQVCEGLYATGVSSLGLTLASFTRGLDGVDMASSSQLQLRWKPLGTNQVRLRADSLRPRFYYRMDATRPASTGQMAWNNAIPAQYRLRTSEFGILATQSDDAGKRVYLPLHVSTAGRDTPPGPYTVTVVSATELEEIYWSLTREGRSGFIVRDQPLERSPYPAGQPVLIRLESVDGPGRYELTVSADLVGGAIDTIVIPFYHVP